MVWLSKWNGYRPKNLVRVCRGLPTVFVLRVILLWRMFGNDKSEGGMLINPRIVFTFTCHRWSSTTFSWHLALLAWRSNILNICTSSTYFFHLATSLFYVLLKKVNDSFFKTEVRIAYIHFESLKGWSQVFLLAAWILVVGPGDTVCNSLGASN